MAGRAGLLLATLLSVSGAVASICHCTRIIDAVDLASVPNPSAVSTPPPDFLWYVLDETQGTTAKDSSSHRYDIVNLGGITWGNGANFDGVSVCGSTQVDPLFRDPPLTISGWLTAVARADETSTQNDLVPYPTNAISNDEPGQFGYGLGLNVWSDGDGGSALGVEEVDTCQKGPLPHLCVANSSVGKVGPFVAGHEYFIVAAMGPMVGDASTLAAQVYVDGRLYDETTAMAPGNLNPTTVYLGCHNLDITYGSKRFFAGRIRDARVYKRQLGAAEVTQLFANGPTKTAPHPANVDAASDGS